MKILHISTSLDGGGAEHMMADLVRSLSTDNIDQQVIGLTQMGSIGKQLEGFGMDVFSLNANPGRFSLGQFSVLGSLIRKFKPDIVQTWLYHANLIGGISARLSGASKVVWGIHHADLSHQGMRRSTRLVAKTGALLSGILPDRIAVCAQSAIESHAAFGYRRDRMIFMPNGVDCARFCRNEQVRSKLRREWDVKDDEVVVGMAARYHPIKNHALFAKAAAIVLTNFPQVRFVLSGAHVDAHNVELVEMLKSAGVFERTILLGPRGDMPVVYSAIDIGVVSSYSEAFPMSLAEMMSSELACVSTDVGDAGIILGEAGKLVPSDDVETFALAIMETIRLPVEQRMALGSNARKRIEDNFSIVRATENYANLYHSLLGGS